MDADIDHYLVLGLPSGEQGFKLTKKEIRTAYTLKALELHPDKRLGDLDASAKFQKMKTSYEILKDEKRRKLYDDQLRSKLRSKQHKHQHELQHDYKRKRTWSSDLYQRERDKARCEDENILRKFKEEVDSIRKEDRIRKMHANKMNFNSAKASTPLKKEFVSGDVDDMEKMLRASWENAGFEYTAQSLRKIFEAFGEVKDVVIRTKKKKGLSVIVMATKEAAVAATRVAVCGDFSNPLLVEAFLTAREPVKSEGPLVNEELVGARSKAYEDSVLQKLQKAAERQK